MTVDEHVAAAIADGFEIVQQGPVVIQFDPKAKPKPTLADRFGDFNAGAVGSGDRLFDDDERWVHLRRRPNP